MAYQKKGETLVLPELSKLMRERGATNLKLAEYAHYDVKTICNARMGRPIRSGTARYILKALNENKFEKDNRGRR